jgi:hypothetical protein
MFHDIPIDENKTVAGPSIEVVNYIPSVCKPVNSPAPGRDIPQYFRVKIQTEQMNSSFGMTKKSIIQFRKMVCEGAGKPAILRGFSTPDDIAPAGNTGDVP